MTRKSGKIGVHDLREPSAISYDTAKQKGYPMHPITTKLYNLMFSFL